MEVRLLSNNKIIMNDAYNAAQMVTNRESFVAFMLRFSAEWKKNPELWENRDFGTYFEALAAWVEDMDGYYQNQGLPVPENINWKVFADILMAARVYE